MNASLNDDTSRSNGNGQSNRRTRGPINKRACQRCRQGKIRCDGNAESGIPCSNCDQNTCKYDNSPRKNKQVEALRQKLDEIEEKLRQQTTAAENLKAQNDQLRDGNQIKRLEKVVIIQLFESREYFNGYDEIFNQLLAVLRDSKAIGPVIQLIQEHLNRLPKHTGRIPEIMESFSSLAGNASERAPESNYGNGDSQQVITAIQTYISSSNSELDPSSFIAPSVSMPQIFSQPQPQPQTSPHVATGYVNVDHLTSPSTNFGLTQLSIQSPGGSDVSASHDGFTPTSPSQQDIKFYSDGCEPRHNEMLSDTTFHPNIFPGYFDNNTFYGYGGADIYIGGGGEQMEALETSDSFFEH